MPGENSGPDPNADFNFTPGAYPGGAAYGQPQVYWGQRENPGFGGEFHGGDRRNPISPVIVETKSVNEAAISYYSDWSEEERRAWAKRMWNAGFIQDPNDIEAAFQLWSQAVSRASDMYTYGGRKITPWQAMDLMEGVNGDHGPKSKTTTSRNYATPNVSDANAMVSAVFQHAFGRAPNDAELSRYRSMIIGKFKSNPSITTQTVDRTGNTTTRTQQGYSDSAAQYDALQQAKADPEYGAYQAATTYFNALMGALGAPG